MRKGILFVIALSGSLLIACTSNRSNNQTSEIDVIEPVTTVVADPIPNNPVVRTSVSDNQGNTITLAFNNSSNTATAELNGEVIYLTQDTTASGIRYSNDNYVYQEWQGHSTLKKDGKTIFDNMK